MTLPVSFPALALACWLSLNPAPLAAHDGLLRSTPAPGDTLLATPPQLRLTFTGTVNPGLARIGLLGPGGPVVLGALSAHPDSGNVVSAAVEEVLGPGKYTVRWRIVGGDGHPVEGTFAFVLASPGPTPQTQEADPGADPGAGAPPSPSSSFDAQSPVYVLVRWLNFAGLMGALGAVAFGLLVLPAAAGSGRLDTMLLRALAAGVGTAAAGMLLATGGARLLAQRAAVFGPSSTLALGDGTVALLSTSWGAGWILQALGGALALGGFLWARRRVRLGWSLALLGTLILSVTPALSGHAAGEGRLRALAILVDALHVIGAGGWIGSLFVLFLAALRGARGKTGEPALPDLVRAFSPLALGFAATLLATGLFAAWLHLGGLGALWGSSYGRTLLLKLAVLAPLMGLGAYNWRRLRPALARSEGQGRFRLSAGAELAIASMVLLVTSVLVATPPPLPPGP